MTELTRRTALRTAGLVTLGLVPLTGCSGSSSDSGSNSGSGGSGSGGDSDADSDGDAGSGGSGGGSGDAPSEVTEYLSDVGNYSGVADRTGSGSVTVAVGAEGNGGNFAFDPAAIRVSTGTEVTWEWTGMGGSHNVVAEDGSFESELVSEGGHTFSHTFEESGVYTYYCQPHKTVGMKGAVVVE